MSSTGQVVGGIVGAVVGYFAGNPILGAQIGMTLGGALDPPKLPTVSGPRLSDLSVQTSSYGVPLARVYGTVPIVGNIFWLENNQLKEVVKKKKTGGKGGPSQTTKTYSYYATFAVALCDTSKTGPILGVRRIWIGSNLWYNAGSNDLETIIAGNQNVGGKSLDVGSGIFGDDFWLRLGVGGDNCRVYLGTSTQEPDARMQADIGVADCPAYRNTAYIVFYDLPLEKYSNSLQAAQVRVELITDADQIAPTTISVLNASGGSESGTNQSGCAMMLSSNGAAYVARLALSEGAFLQDRISLSGSVITTSIASSADYDYVLEGDIDEDGSVLLEASTQSLFIAGTVYALPASTVNEGSVVFKRGGYIVVTKVALSNLLISVLDDVGSLVASTTYSGMPIVAITDAATIAVLDPDYETINILNIETLAVADTFILATPFAIAGYSAAYSSGDFFYVYDDNVSSSRLLVVSISAQAEIARYDMPTPSTGMSPPSVRIKVSGDIAAIYRNGSSTALPSKIDVVRLPHLGANTIPLADIVNAEMQVAGIDLADIDVADLTDNVRGYRITGGSIRGAIAPLQGAYPFDVIPSGYQIKAVPRGQSSVATIDIGELGAISGSGMVDVVLDGPSREMDTQLPRKLIVKHLDADRDYDINEQSQERIATDSVDIETQDIALVMTPTEAAGMAQTLLYLRWMERNDYAFSLPPAYNDLEPADVINVVTDYATIPLRLTEISYGADGVLQCRAKPNAAAIYTPNAAGGQGVIPGGTIPFGGESILVLLDTPMMRADLDDPGFIAVMSGDGSSWPGGAAFRSNDNGMTFDDVQGFGAGCTFGSAVGALSADGGFVIDRNSTLSARWIAGAPESVTEDQILAGYNYYAYGSADRWEIIAIANFDLQSDGSYICSTFLRGMYGTEWATGLHVAGDYLVLLDDPDNAFIGAGYDSFGVEKIWRGVTYGKSVDSASDQAFTYNGVNLKPLSPVNAVGARDGSNNFSATFNRRSRFTDSFWVTGVEPIVGEASESYEIDVLSGAVVVRTIAATTGAFSYSAANQTADGLTPGNPITFRIYQLSATVGRGYKLEVTL